MTEGGKLRKGDCGREHERRRQRKGGWRKKGTEAGAGEAEEGKLRKGE